MMVITTNHKPCSVACSWPHPSTSVWLAGSKWVKPSSWRYSTPVILNIVLLIMPLFDLLVSFWREKLSELWLGYTLPGLLHLMDWLCHPHPVCCWLCGKFDSIGVSIKVYPMTDNKEHVHVLYMYEHKTSQNQNGNTCCEKLIVHTVSMASGINTTKMHGFNYCYVYFKKERSRHTLAIFLADQHQGLASYLSQAHHGTGPLSSLLPCRQPRGRGPLSPQQRGLSSRPTPEVPGHHV